MSIKASIVIRTKNEERWISHTLQAVFSQKYESFEVILVDNESTDHTVDIAKRFPLKAIVNIEDFTPGKALNAGALESSGDFLVFLSAHCVPKDDNWLSNLLKPFSTIEGLAGVYGRQLPVSFSSPIDKRDLLLVFGADSRTQIKDYFFHNANSAIPRKLWEKYPFDESVKNVEDRVWGRTVITKGYVIYYEAK